MENNNYIKEKFRDSKGIVFFDIDGTLLPYGSMNPLPSTKEAIRMLKAKNYTVFIATGKSYYEASKVGRKLDITNYISSNGNVMHIDNKLLYMREIPEELIKRLIHNLKGHKVTIGMHGNEKSQIINGQSNETLIEFLKTVSIELPFIEEEYFSSFPVTQLWISGEYEEQSMPSELKVIPWHIPGGDVNFEEASKGRMITENFRWHRNTIAFGDGNNDIEMFQSVKISIAMGNASSKVKQNANHVTDRCDNNGIYKYIKNFVNN